LSYIDKLNTEDAGFLGCDVLLGEWFLTFAKSVVPSLQSQGIKEEFS